MKRQLKEFFKEFGIIIHAYLRWMVEHHKSLLGSFKNLFINLYYDSKLNIDTIKRKRENLVKDGLHYVATNYALLKKILHYLKLKPSDVFVDIGCGKGRPVLFVANQCRIKKAIGIEADNKLFRIAKQNLNNLKTRRTAVFLYHCNAANFDFNEGTVFFMSHPFGVETLEAVLDKIHKTALEKHHKIRIVYVNPVFSYLLDKKPWLKFEKNMGKGIVHVWHSI